MTIKLLSEKETSFVSGGNANSNYEGGSSYTTGNNASSGGIGYGAQAEGNLPNTAAAGHGLLNDLGNPCVAATASGVVGVAGAIASRSPSGIATAVGSAAIGIGSTCNQPSNQSSSDGAPFR